MKKAQLTETANELLKVCTEESRWGFAREHAIKLRSDLDQLPEFSDDRTCYKCDKQSVCKIKSGADELFLKNFALDFDKPGGAAFLDLSFQLIAARCRYFFPSISSMETKRV